MNLLIELSSVAEAEADRAFLRLSQLMSIEQVKGWYDGLFVAIGSLSQMPRRCAMANCHRIIFVIIETEDRAIVRILHVRHASQQTVGDELEGQN